MHQSNSVLVLAQAYENLSIDVIKLLFRPLICNQSTLNIIPCRTPCLLLVIEKKKKRDRMFVPATRAGKIAWVPIAFSVSLSQELSWNALLFGHFSLVYVPPASSFGFCAALDCPCRLCSCGIPGATQDQQPELRAGSWGHAALPRGRIWGVKSSCHSTGYLLMVLGKYVALLGKETYKP